MAIAALESGYAETTFQRRLRQRERDALVAPDRDDPAWRAINYAQMWTMVGNTPLLLTKKIGNSRIITKFENQNPTESHYDRIVLTVLGRLERDGVIKPGDELVELTSGSGGNSFAWACSRLGYKLRLIVSGDLPEGRIQEMKNFDAVLEQMNGYVAKNADRMRAEIAYYRDEGYEIERHKTDDYLAITARRGDHRICWTNHSEHAHTVRGFEQIGVEVSEVLPRDRKALDYFVVAIGNWTTAIGMPRGLRRKGYDFKVIGFESAQRPVAFSLKYPDHPISIEFRNRVARGELDGEITFGLGDPGIRLKWADPDLVDEIRLVDRLDMERGRKAYNEGRYEIDTVGDTTIGAWLVAEELASENDCATILTTAYDKGGRYIDNVLADADLDGITNPYQESARIPIHGVYQPRVQSVDDLPTSLLDLDAGGWGLNSTIGSMRPLEEVRSTIPFDKVMHD